MLAATLDAADEAAFVVVPAPVADETPAAKKA
jgi:hypothetical protein